jgi:hypothetical protein
MLAPVLVILRHISWNDHCVDLITSTCLLQLLGKADMFSLTPSVSLLTAFGGLYLLLPACARALHRKLVEKQTGLADIPFLGEARTKDRKIKGTAVVCGGR